MAESILRKDNKMPSLPLTIQRVPGSNMKTLKKVSPMKNEGDNRGGK